MLWKHLRRAVHTAAKFITNSVKWKQPRSHQSHSAEHRLFQRLVKGRRQQRNLQPGSVQSAGVHHARAALSHKCIKVIEAISQQLLEHKGVRRCGPERLHR